MKIFLIILIVFASWQGFGNLENPNLFHFLKTENAALPTFPKSRENNTTSEAVLLDGNAPGLKEVKEWANNLESEMLMSFRKLECAKDYG